MLSFLFFVLISFFLVIFLTFVKFIISNNSFYQFTREEVSSHECGFEQNSLSRLPLSIRYFLLTLVFLIFDIEVILLLLSPVDVVFSVSSSLLIISSVVFILILIFGLLFEWYDGALE